MQPEAPQSAVHHGPALILKPEIPGQHSRQQNLKKCVPGASVLKALRVMLIQASVGESCDRIA